MTWNPWDLCSCKPEISKQPVDIFEKDTRVGTGSQGWFCSIVVIFVANFWRGSSLSGFRHELEDTIQVLWGSFFTHPPKWVFNRTSPKKVVEIGKLSPDFSSFQCGNIQLFPFRWPIKLVSLSTDFEQNYPTIFIWGWIFILPATGGRLWLMAVLETSQDGALERMCLSLFHRFGCEGTLDLQVCKLKISESLFNRCIIFFYMRRIQDFRFDSYPPRVFFSSSFQQNHHFIQSKLCGCTQDFHQIFYVPKGSKKVESSSHWTAICLKEQKANWAVKEKCTHCFTYIYHISYTCRWL